MPSVSELGALVKSKYPGKYDDLPDSTLGRLTKQKYPDAYSDFSGTEEPSQMTYPQAFGEGLLRSLPGVGGLLGSTGGPLGAARGGALGKSLEDLIRSSTGMQGAPESPQQAITDVAIGGGVQGVLEGIGRLPQMLAKPMIQAAIGPTKGSRTDVAQTALDKMIPATRAGRNKLSKLIGAAGTHTRSLLANHPGRIDPIRLTSAVDDLTPNLVNHPSGKEIGEEYAKMSEKFIKDHPFGVTPVQLQGFKQAWDEAAEPIYRAMNSKNPVPLTGQQINTAKWSKAMADRARNILHASVPGVKEADFATEGLINLQQALAPAAKQDVPAAVRLARAYVPAAAAGGIAATLPGTAEERAKRALEVGLMVQLARTPGFMSNAALFLNNPTTALLMRQAPRVAAEVLNQGQ